MAAHSSIQESLDPRAILYSPPTINDAMPSMEQGSTKLAGGCSS